MSVCICTSSGFLSLFVDIPSKQISRSYYASGRLYAVVLAPSRYLIFPAERSSEGPVKPTKGLLGRISAKPGESKSASNPASKEEAPKAKKGMLGRISAKIVEQKAAPATEGPPETKDDSSNKPKRNMLSRISVTGKGGDSKGSLATADEPSVRGGMRGMLSRISAKPGGPDTAPSAAASNMEDISVRGKRGMLARISGRPEEPRKDFDDKKMSKEYDCDDEYDMKEGRVLLFINSNHPLSLSARLS